MWFAAGLVEEVAPVDVVVADQGHNQARAFLLMLEKAALNMARNVKFRRSISAIAATLAAGKADRPGGDDQPARAELIHGPTRALLLHALLLRLSALATLCRLGNLKHLFRCFLILADLLAGAQFATTLFNPEMSKFF